MVFTGRHTKHHARPHIPNDHAFQDDASFLSQGFKKLQLLLKAILLRRTKGSTINGTPIINLPERRQELVKVNLSRDEAAFYKQVCSVPTVGLHAYRCMLTYLRPTRRVKR